MPRGFKKSKKDPFDALPPEFKEAAASASSDVLKAQMGLISTDEQLNLAAMKADQDLKEKQNAAKLAKQGYSEVSKINKLKTRFIVVQLSDRGDPKSSEIVTLQKQGEENV